ncbi:MAG: triose-phosphate isomerase, partial [Acidimicrobiales bacterium]
MSDRELLISGNWKMNHTHFDAIQFVQTLAALLRANPLRAGRALSVHPSFTALRSVQTALESDTVPVFLGAQNCHEAEKGAFTGEVSAEMLEKLNVSYVIVGHSERRQ